MPNKNNQQVRAITAIVCDEVRVENNGKPFLIGVYTGSINIEAAEIPVDKDIYNFQMAIWLLLELKQIGEINVDLQIKTPNAEKAILVKAKAIIDKLPMKGEIIPVSIGPLPLKLWHDGEIEIQFRNQIDSEWETIRVLPVTVKVNPSLSNTFMGA